MPAPSWNATPIVHGAADASSSQLAPPIENRENADDSLFELSIEDTGPDFWENVDDSDVDDGFSNAPGSEVGSREAASVGIRTNVGAVDWLQQGADALLANLGSPCVGAAVPGEDETFEEQFGDFCSDSDLAGIRKQSVCLRPSSSK